MLEQYKGWRKERNRERDPEGDRKGGREGGRKQKVCEDSLRVTHCALLLYHLIS